MRPEDIDERFVPARGPWVHTVEIDGEAVLLDEERDRLHMVNMTGALVWACFDGEASVADIVTDISEELNLDYDVVLADTLGLIGHLGEQGLIANVIPGPDLDEQEVVPRPEEAVGDEADDCADDDVAGAVAAANAPSDDPRFVAEPPNP